MPASIGLTCACEDPQLTSLIAKEAKKEEECDDRSGPKGIVEFEVEARAKNEKGGLHQASDEGQGDDDFQIGEGQQAWERRESAERVLSLVIGHRRGVEAAVKAEAPEAEDEDMN